MLCISNYAIEITTVVSSIIATIIALISCHNSQKQYLSNIKPFLRSTFKSDKKLTKQVSCLIETCYNPATLIDVIPLSKNIYEIKSDKLAGYDIDPDSEFVEIDIIFNKTIDRDNDMFIIAIKYADKAGNKYIGILRYDKELGGRSVFVRDVKYPHYLYLRLSRKFR